jgi:hypothetical protein
MNERQQAHIDVYLERLDYWRMLKDPATARMLAARDAYEVHPLMTEEEVGEVVAYCSRLERERTDS